MKITARVLNEIPGILRLVKELWIAGKVINPT